MGVEQGGEQGEEQGGEQGGERAGGERAGGTRSLHGFRCSVEAVLPAPLSGVSSEVVVEGPVAQMLARGIRAVRSISGLYLKVNRRMMGVDKRND